MLKHLKNLCLISGASGNEEKVREYILKEISEYCNAKVDVNGNIICHKTGKNKSAKKVMIDAHMDEVGFIVTDITDDGLLKFATVGGIEPESIICKNVEICGHSGVIGIKPIHLSSKEELKVLPDEKSLYIDIGAENKEDAEKLVSPGDIGTFSGNYELLSDNTVKSKALDDRFGCAVIIELLKSDADYDFFATFTVGEELGCRGARTAAFSVAPDYSIVIEATTAGDIHGVSTEETVCNVGGGAVVSFMDKGTLYDRKLYDKTFELAKKHGIAIQPKRAVAGGNNASAISLSRSGVKTIAISAPCRYIHSPSGVAAFSDMLAVKDIAALLLKELASGGVE